MKTFRVHYYFDGVGSVLVEGKTPEEAEERFHSGDYKEECEEEWGENYTIKNTAVATEEE